MNDYTAVGIHVFAGGFTAGIQAHPSWTVARQLETFDLGRDTVQQRLGLEFHQSPAYEWPSTSASLAYGNPRCTAFSCMTSNCGETGHGAFAKQTVDILELTEYATFHEIPVIAWESVQQAFTTGRPLLEHICEAYYFPKDYRVAHLLLNAASFGNVQNRKRYFFVAYKRGLTFNVAPPVIEPHYRVLWDAIGHLDVDRETYAYRERDTPGEYGPDHYPAMTENDAKTLPHLPNGWNVNKLARWYPDALPKKHRITWEMRMSSMPFSLHCPSRLHWLRPCPTISSSARNFVHPCKHRALTVGEVALAMGWDYIPAGPSPIGQIAKGIVPAIGTWLAEQVRKCLDDEWGGEDWESSYDAKVGEWRGRDVDGAREKIFNLTKYVGRRFDRRRFPVHLPMHQWGDALRGFTPAPQDGTPYSKVPIELRGLTK